MNNFTKKIQQKGWSHKAYSAVRNKVEEVFGSEDNVAYIRLKRTNKCIRNHGQHNYVVTEVKEYAFSDSVFTTRKCSRCEKKKLEWTRVKKD